MDGGDQPVFEYVFREHGLHMIEALKSDEIVKKMGGRFKLTALIQRRLQELIEGSRPHVERRGRTDLELVIEEIETGKIEPDWSDTEYKPRRPKGL